jgi:hypothetical protein
MLWLSHGCIESDQQLPHASDEGDLLGVALLRQMLVVLAVHRVVAGGDERGHVERSAHRGSAAADASQAAMLTRVVIARRDANQGAEGRDVGPERASAVP